MARHPDPGTEMAALGNLQNLVLESAEAQEFLQNLALFSATALSGPADVLSSVPVERGSVPATVASSHPRALAMDQLQYRYNEGPCLAALRTNTTKHIHVLREEDRWPLYCTAAWSEASKTLRLAIRVAALAEDRRNMTGAMGSNTPVSLAAGVIMAENRCGQDTALRVLKMASSTRNIKLHTVAETIVASVAQNPKVLAFLRN
ncbi:ANTAR domain-containing protein [Paenarthrobacter sp. DKR-5]|nr:ANTAR domain-containing protein [Paenarthrobacter sp. DKR-5]